MLYSREMPETLLGGLSCLKKETAPKNLDIMCGQSEITNQNQDK